MIHEQTQPWSVYSSLTFTGNQIEFSKNKKNNFFTSSQQNKEKDKTKQLPCV